MQNVFNLPRRLLLALAVVLVALTVFFTHQLMYAGTTGAFGAVVLSCAGLLALLIVAGFGHVVDALNSLRLASLAGASSTATSYAGCASGNPTHRQNLELSAVREVIHTISRSGDGE